MKVTELLQEAVSTKLARLLKSDQFVPIGNNYVFIWTDDLLRSLLQAGAKSGDELDTLRTPGSIGIGIVNGKTGDVCVGAIDSDFDALWASSMDVSDFFMGSGNKNIIRLPNRLQNLADLLADYDYDDSNQDFKSDKTGVSAIVDHIKNDDNLDELSPYLNDISKLESVDDVKDYLEDLLNDAKSIRAKGDDVSYEEYDKAHAEQLAIEYFFKHKSHLLHDDEGEVDKDLKSKLDKWTSSFRKDFPGLRASAIDFHPDF